jgi:pimeloyl-ACP methyl ester carboxylesterase
MASTRGRLALGAAAVATIGVAAAGGRLLLKQSANSIKERSDDQLDPLYELPPDVEHHQIPSVDGGSLHVVERGVGRPLLLVHGITLQAGVWAPQFNLLADRYRVMAMDVRGHGRSVEGSDGFGRKIAARDVKTVLDHFDLHDVILVGHSMGGMIVMELAGDFPEILSERVAGLVFMDTAAYEILPRPALPIAKALGRRINTRFDRGKPIPQRRVGEDDLSWVLARVAFGRNPSAKAVGQVRRFLEEVPQSTSLPSGIDLLDHDARVALQATRTPSLVLVGSMDLLTPVWAARRIAKFLPFTRFEILDGAGHQLMQERPFEFASLLDEFSKSL